MEIMMIKILRTVAVALSIVSIFFFSGCGLFDWYIEREVKRLVHEHFEKNSTALAMWEPGDCTDFNISEAKDGVRNGSINLCLKHRTSGRVEKLPFDVKYNAESGYIYVNLHDPMMIVQLAVSGADTNHSEEEGSKENKTETSGAENNSSSDN
jgi:hypothetical protein